MTCPACGATLSATARFCHKCGTAVAASAPSDSGSAWRIGLPWGIAGAALGALVTVLAMRTGGGPGPRQLTTLAGPSAQLPAPDISQMSPEERATRLFNRVMRLAEENKTDSVQFFLPMALSTYAQLPALDADARYHVGVLQLAGGNAAGALAQADSIRQATPTHLFAYVLRARAYELRNETRNVTQAFRDFLRYESQERARQRPEYADHAQTLDAVHTEAQNRAADSPRP